MKKVRNIFSFGLTGLFLFFLLVSCEKNSDDDGNGGGATTVSVTSFSPGTLRAGDVVTINGTGFGTNSSVVSVKFNGKPAAGILSVSNTTITASVPEMAGSGKISVTVATNTATSTDSYIFLYTGTVSSLSGDFKAMWSLVPSDTSNFFVGSTYTNAGTNYDIVKKITLSGTITDIAGNDRGYTDGTGSAAKFAGPLSGACRNASTGDLYFAESNGNRIRKVTTLGVVTTFAGSGVAGSADGTGTAAQFNMPRDMVMDASGNIYLADANNHRIRKISPAGVVTTFAGSGTAGYADGSGTAAQFNYPAQLAIDASGNLYVSDVDNHRIRKITSGGLVSTVAGSGTAGFMDGATTNAQFNKPWGVAIDEDGNIYVADAINKRIRMITTNGQVSTLAGNDTSVTVDDGVGTSASFFFPWYCKLIKNKLYVLDQSNSPRRIRIITIK